MDGGTTAVRSLDSRSRTGEKPGTLPSAFPSLVISPAEFGSELFFFTQLLLTVSTQHKSPGVKGQDGLLRPLLTACE